MTPSMSFLQIHVHLPITHCWYATLLPLHLCDLLPLACPYISPPPIPNLLAPRPFWRSLPYHPLQVGFQFTYTCIFGWYETYLFLRTGNLLAPVVAHSFANWMGVPPFGHMARQVGPWAAGLLTVAGVAAFAALVVPLTHPALYA